MKLFQLAILPVLMLLATTNTRSQTITNSIFPEAPSQINCTQSSLEQAFNATEGQHIVINLTAPYTFAGTVISNIQKYDNLQSVTILSDQLEKTIFQLSRQQLDETTIRFVGKILSPKTQDGYSLLLDESGNYRLEKFAASTVYTECKL